MRCGFLVWSWALLLGCGSSERDAGDGAARGGSGNALGGASGDGGAGVPGGSAGTTAASAGKGAATFGGSGGAGSAGGATGGSSTGGSATRPDPATATETQACLYYLRKACHRMLSECQWRPEVEHACANIEDSCPDKYFSDGSTFSVASLIACAESWQQLSCEEVGLGVQPECLPKGTKALGETCLFATQCDSLWCRQTQVGTCGVCSAKSGAGDPCDSPDVCQAGLYCESGTCTAPVILADGAACTIGDYCSAASSCIPIGQPEATCQYLPTIGEPCPVGLTYCRNGFCDAAARCQPRRGAGEACGSGATQGICGAGLLCSSGSASQELGTCVAAAAMGEACSPGGADLASIDDCKPDLNCHCTDAECTLGACAKVRAPGEPCPTVNDVCLGSSRCEAGVCVDGGGQDLYTAACSP